jgi:predicted nucleotidyltransferase
MHPDFLDLLRSLRAADARFLLVGAYAVGVHGRPRATKDLDVWVEPSVENAPKVMRALVDFGAPLMGLTIQDLETPEVGLQIGVAPVRIDVLTKITGVTFEEAWPRRIEADFDAGVRCAVIGLEDLLKNKRAAGRPQDLADVAALERLRDLKRWVTGAEV